MTMRRKAHDVVVFIGDALSTPAHREYRQTIRMIDSGFLELEVKDDDPEFEVLPAGYHIPGSPMRDEIAGSEAPSVDDGGTESPIIAKIDDE